MGPYLRYKDTSRESDDEDDEKVPEVEKLKTRGTVARKKQKGRAKQSKSQKAKPSRTAKKGEASSYKAGSFNEERLKFIKNLREKDGLGWKEASERWMASSKRQGLLDGMSYSELVRRRFVDPHS